MDTRDLMVFLKVYEYSNMTKAAHELFMSTQGVSKIIIKLENHFQVQFFQRTATGLTPTEEAHIFKANAQKLLDDFWKVQQTFSGVLSVEHKKTLKIATTTGVFRYVTLKFVNDFHKKYPHINLEIIEQLDPTVNELLWNEVVDLAFNSAPINLFKFDADLFSSHKYCLLLHHSHPLAQKETIAYADLKDYPLAIIRSFHYHMNALYQANITPNIVYETMDINFLNEVAENNHAICISIDFVAISRLGSNTVIKFFEDEKCTWDSYLITKKNKTLNTETLLFKDFALSWIQKHKTTLFPASEIADKEKIKE